MSVRGKVIRAARQGKASARAVEHIRPSSVSRYAHMPRPRSQGRMAAQRVARATREIKSGSSVSSRFSRTKAMASSVGTGKKSSRFLAGGLAVAYGGGAIMNRRGPAADRVNGIRNTGVYEF